MNKTSLRITYRPRAAATPKDELNVLAVAYRFVLFESRASKEGAHGTALEDAMKGSTHGHAR